MSGVATLRSETLHCYAERLEHGLRLARRAHPSSSSSSHQQPFMLTVPPLMRRANATAYEPAFFTFGLFHAPLIHRSHPPQNLQQLPPCDIFKIQIAHALTSEDSFEQFLLFLVRRMPHPWMLYACDQQSGCNTDDIPQPRELALILALDALTVVAAACFQECILPRSMCTVIWRDAFLMEQQLPLYVLQAALDSIALDADQCALSECSPSANSSVESSQVDTVVSFDVRRSADFRNSCILIDDVVKFYALHTYYPFMRNVQALKECRPSPIDDPVDMEQTLLSRIHSTFIDKGSKRKHHVVSTQFRRMPTATRLQQCGIKFAVGDGGFTGIYFDRKSKVLTLPEITVFSTTKSYLLNLVAQEAATACYDDDPCPVSSYIILMGFLIDTEKDVRLLVDAQVVVNHLGSHKELAAMWNSLGNNLPISLTEEDSGVIDAVREAAASETWRWQRTSQQYTKRPWLLLNAVLAVFFLLALTCLQTTYTVLHFYSRRQ